MKSEKLKFLFAIHCHQPVGNFEHVFEQCFADCYRPLIETLARHPKIKCSLHYSGPLLLFIEKKHKDHLILLREMTARGQVEWIGGGFYEPILPTIPARDAVAQIVKMREWLRAQFHFDPRGLWLTERVWEPGLPTVLREAGVEFTLLDDTHFLSAGIQPSDMLGYYRTEDSGSAVDVFPIDWTLRKFIPFHTLDETFGYFWQLKERAPGAAVTLGDDGEKFGVWPGTHKQVYEEKYLEQFLDRLEESSEWLETAHFADVRASQSARGMVYMPTASYPEMMEWALPFDARVAYQEVAQEIKNRGDHERFERFLRGAHWRNFFAKYAESNLMHKKMLYLSRKLHQQKTAAGSLTNGLDHAYDALWQGQCNCAYWHGLFGGLYLGHLRQGIYHQLLDAEVQMKTSAESGAQIELETVDFDCDGRDEILVSGPIMNLYIQPHYGGSVFEFDVLPLRANLSNVLTRRPEPYHSKIALAAASGSSSVQELDSIHKLNLVKEDGLDKRVVHDWYLKRMFQDHLLVPDITLEKFSRADSGEIGDFVDQPYRVVEAATHPTGGAKVVLERQGGVYRGSEGCPVSIRKTYHVKKDIGRIEYEIAPSGSLRAQFGIEINLTLPDSISPGQHLLVNRSTKAELSETLEFAAVDAMTVVDDRKKMKLSFKATSKFRLWTYPLETVSQSESGLERTYQGTSALLAWPVELDAGQTQKITLEFKLTLP